MLLAPENISAPEAADWLSRADRVAARIATLAARHDADDSFVAEGYAQLKAEGLFKALVPVEFGGGGATIAEICQVIRRLGAASLALRRGFRLARRPAGPPARLLASAAQRPLPRRGPHTRHPAP